ncbi:MAG: tetratricopeptide repeat protein, partial [Candidatus Latescibacterota bacterium]
RVMLCAALLGGPLGVSAALAEQTPAVLLEEGLTKETADGDLEAAIAVFRRIVQEHPEAGSVAASAQLHIGLCYEKLGRREAAQAYEQVIAQFPAETEIVAQARERLSALQQAAATPRPEVGAGPQRTTEVVERLQQQRAKVASYRGTMTMAMDVLGRQTSLQGTVQFRRPNLYRSEMEGPGAVGRTLSVTRGDTIWAHQSISNLVFVTDVGSLGREYPQYGSTSDPSQPFGGLARESLSYIRSDRIGEQEVSIFQGQADSTAARLGSGLPQPDWVEVWVGAADGLLRRRIDYRDPGTQMRRMELDVAAVNVPIPDSAFAFTPPPGAQVMDVTSSIRALLAGAASAAAPGAPAPAPPDVSAILTELEQARKAVTSYHANAVLQMRMMGTTVTQHLTEWEQQGRSRQEMTGSLAPGVTITVGDSLVRWTYVPALSMVQRLDLQRLREASAEGRAAAGGESFEGMARDSVAFVGTEALDGVEVYRLKGPGPGALQQQLGLSFASVEMWLGKADGLVRKRVMYGTGGEEVMSETRTGVEVNVALPDTLFSFTPPPGVQVMDLTENVINQVRRLR